MAMKKMGMAITEMTPTRQNRLFPKMIRPYTLVTGVYSSSMLLYYLAHVFIYYRNDPNWLGELYMIFYFLPAIFIMWRDPETQSDLNYKLFIRTSFLIFVTFDCFCLYTGENLIVFKRIVSAFTMCILPLVFVALFLYNKKYKTYGYEVDI